MENLIYDEIIKNLSAFISGETPSDLEVYDQYRRLRDILFDQLPPSTVKLIKRQPQKHLPLIRKTLLILEESSSNTRKILRALAPQVKNQSQRPNADILIITATQVETKAFIDDESMHTQSSLTKYFIDSQTYHYLGVTGGSNIYLIQSEMGAGGPSGSILTINEAIKVLSPRALIMAGIAFGVDSNKQKLGDILIARQLLSYEPQRVGTNLADALQIRVRGDRVSSSPKLIDRFRSGSLDWAGPQVHFGLVLSGEKLIDNQEFRGRLLELEPEAIGGEMEGAGLYAAAHRSKTDWLLIKSICDWADGRKSYQKDKRQQQAATTTARFIYHVLGQGGFN